MGNYGGEDAQYNKPQGAPRRTPPRPKPKPRVDPYDERSYSTRAPQVSGLYQHLQDNKVPYYADAYKEYNQTTAAAREQSMLDLIAPQGPGSGPSGGGGSGDGGAAAQSALRSMFQIYGRPEDTSLQDNLNRIIGQAQSTGNDALAALQGQLGAQENPYLKQYAAPQVASNPLAEYMRAGGVDSSGVDAMQNMLGASAQTTRDADQMVMDRMSQSWQASQQSRQGDAAFLGQQFQQALANSSAASQAQIVQQSKKAKDDLMMQILQMAVSSGQDLGQLGITF